MVKTVNSLKSSYNLNVLPSNVVSLVHRSINYTILKDFTSEEANMEFQVLGLVGKMLTG